jgi:Na+-transporting methylmalonyl-CoA/oxaloacetate decarboxylase gamma subunit
MNKKVILLFLLLLVLVGYVVSVLVSRARDVDELYSDVQGLETYYE